MMSPDSARVRELLREVQYPGFSRDIVASGFIGTVSVIGSTVDIEFKPDTRDEGKIYTMEQNMRQVLRNADFADVRIRRSPPYVIEVPLRKAEDLARDVGLAVDIGSRAGAAIPTRLMTPLQAELLEDGQVPEADLLAIALGRLDVAPGAGYRPGGPEPLSGPRMDLAYDTGVRVLQWDINPQDHEAETYQEEVHLDDWDYRVWWQVHRSADLLYVSMQAMKEDWVDHDNNAVPHPIGRSEAVNLVYDETRHAVVAIYGTVRDFRPFVKAFGLAYASAKRPDNTPATEEAGDQ